MRFMFFLLTSLLFCASTNAQCTSEGVPINGYPNWFERTMLTTVNAVRMAPTDYKAVYMPGAGADVLAPTHYPPVQPLLWSYGLNQSARYHCEIEATQGCFQHNECDGTPWFERWNTFYPNWNLAGNNIGAGSAAIDPLFSTGAYLFDAHNGAPAPDGSGFDGHRWNIMYGNYLHLGVGHVHDPASQLLYYQSQDFGRPNDLNTAVMCTPFIMGSHVFLYNTFPAQDDHFLLDYYAPDPAQSVSVVVCGVSYPMTLHLGTTAKGTYRFTIPMIDHCRFYHFEATDSVGNPHRYPSHGEFYTYWEGRGTNSLNPPATTCMRDWTWCATDFDQDTILSMQDLFSFLNAWLGSDPFSDFNGNGTYEVQDIYDYLNAWLLGCPA